MVEILVGVSVLILWFYWKWKTNSAQYWPSKGVWQGETMFPIGTRNTLDSDFVKGINKGYEEAKKHGQQSMFGILMFSYPMLGVSDPEITKHILVKDFDSFVDRVNAGFNEMLIHSTSKVSRNKK